MSERESPARVERQRPRVHFTANEGWINDPYGIAWVDGRYHLYHQAVPGRLTWSPHCHWGHAVSDDLVHWVEEPNALVPQEFEVGCWSGTVVHTAEPPTMFYTRITRDDWDMGAVATAQRVPGRDTWHTEVGDVVIHAPPERLGVRSFRDPFVFYDDDSGWAMIIAAELPDQTAAVLLYRSADMLRWSYEAILCSRPRRVKAPVCTGSMWECPQLFPLQGRWVLVVSVSDGGDGHYAAASMGDYDGHTFSPDTWSRVTYGDSAYATSAFADREGRRCTMSWLREEPTYSDALTRWAGALSVPSTIEIGPGGLLAMRPHPNIDAARSRCLSGTIEGQTVEYAIGGHAVDVTFPIERGWQAAVVERGRTRVGVSASLDGRTLQVSRPGMSSRTLPLPKTAHDVRILVDADIIEVFADGSYGAYRIAPASDPAATTLAATKSIAEAHILDD